MELSGQFHFPAALSQVFCGEIILDPVKNTRPSDPEAYSLIDCAALTCMFVCGFLSACLDHAFVCFFVHLYMDYELSLRKREQFIIIIHFVKVDPVSE